jgi:hypothetical protein
LGISYNYNQRQRAIQPFAKKELLILNYRKPNILAYGYQQTTGPFRFPTNGISSTYTAIEPSYDLSSDHSPVLATISTTPIYIQLTPRLHNSRTNWNNYRTKINEEINLHISLKSCTEVDESTNNFISLLQEAAQVHNKDVVNIPLEIKKLLAEKRKTSATWQRSHTPSDKTAFNKLSNHLKSKLQAMRANSL